MTNTNVFHFNSVNRSPALNTNVATGKSKSVDPEAAFMFASMMQYNCSTKTESLKDNADKACVTDDFSKFQCYDKEIEEAQPVDISDVVSNSTEQIDEFQQKLVELITDQLGIDEDSLNSMLDQLGMTVFDLMMPQNLVQFMTNLTGDVSPTELLVNPQFQDLMQDIAKMSSQLMDDLDITSDQMNELVAQMDVLTEPQSVQDVALDVHGQTVSGGMAEVVAEEKQVSDKAVMAEDSMPVESDFDQNDTVRQLTAEQQSDQNENQGQEQTQKKENVPFKKDMDQTQSPVTEQKFHTMVTSDTELSDVSAELLENDSYRSIDTLDVIEQIAKNVKVNISGNTTSMEMQLNPENLGKIYLQVSAKEGVVNAQITASNEAVKAALESQIADLRDNLNQAGVKVDAVEVTVASHEFEKNLEQNQSRDKQEGERQQEQAAHRRNISLSSLDELSGLMTEEENLAAQIMRENGNSIDYTA